MPPDPNSPLGKGATICETVEEAFPPQGRRLWLKHPAEDCRASESTNVEPHRLEHGVEYPALSHEVNISGWTGERGPGGCYPLTTRSARATPLGAWDICHEAVPPHHMPGTFTDEERLSRPSSPSPSSTGSDITVYPYEDARDTTGDAVSHSSRSHPQHFTPHGTIRKDTKDSRVDERLSSSFSLSRATHGQEMPEYVSPPVVTVSPSARPEGRERDVGCTASWRWVVSFGAVSEALSMCLAGLGAELYSHLAGDHLPTLQAMTVAAVTAAVAIVIAGGSFAAVALWRHEERMARQDHRTMNLVQKMEARRAERRLRDDLAAQVVCAVFVLIAISALPLGMAVSRKPDGFRAREGVLVNAVAIGVLVMACLPLGLPALLAWLWVRRRWE